MILYYPNLLSLVYSIEIQPFKIQCLILLMKSKLNPNLPLPLIERYLDPYSLGLRLKDQDHKYLPNLFHDYFPNLCIPSR